MLAGKARFGEIFCGRARAHGDIGPVGANTPRQVAIGLADGGGEILRPHAVLDRRADRFAGFGDRGLPLFQCRELGCDQRPEAVRLDEAPVSSGGDGKARRHLDAVRRQVAHQLSERSVLASDRRHVAAREVLEPAYVVRRRPSLHVRLEDCLMTKRLL